jgi:hypothetical protein
MQRTADFHDQIIDARLPQAAGIVDNATALDTAVDMLDAHAPTREAPLGPLGATRGRRAPRPALVTWHSGAHDRRSDEPHLAVENALTRHLEGDHLGERAAMQIRPLFGLYQSVDHLGGRHHQAQTQAWR